VSRDRLTRSRRRFWGIGVAAAAALAGIIWAGRSPDPEAGAPIAVQVALPDTAALETAELDSLLETMDASEPSLDDLDTNELELVLRTLEG
jgi:hypothetical protein